jgi:hypothetical protein
VYFTDHQYDSSVWTNLAIIRKLDTQSTAASPTVTTVAGGLYCACARYGYRGLFVCSRERPIHYAAAGWFSGGDFDGPALGAGKACWGVGAHLALDSSERYLYFLDGFAYLRMFDMQAGTITRVAGDPTNNLDSPLDSDISHFAPGPALGIPFSSGASGLAWNQDKTVLYVADGGYNTMPLRALTFTSPGVATMYDFSIDHRGRYIPDPWGNLQYESDRMIAVTVNPANGNVFTLGQFLWAVGVAPSPPPLPPLPPPPPPLPPPSPAPGSPQRAPTTVACFNVAHRFAAAPAVSGAYTDTGRSPAWSGTAMGWSWPSSKYPPQDYGISVLSGDYDQPLGSELYNSQWGALTFTGEEGLLINTAADAYVGDASAGLSIAIWFTPRATTMGPQAMGRNTLLALSKRGSNGGDRSSPTHNTTLRLVYSHNGDVSLGQQNPNVRAQVVQCCTPPTTSTDYADSSDYTVQARKLWGHLLPACASGCQTEIMRPDAQRFARPRRTWLLRSSTISFPPPSRTGAPP